MSKPTKSLTDSKTDSLFPGQPLITLYSSPETLIWKKQCEAREWVNRYRAKAREDGAERANQWWRMVIMDIERIRGLEAAIELRHLMNLERKK